MAFTQVVGVSSILDSQSKNLLDVHWYEPSNQLEIGSKFTLNTTTGNKLIVMTEQLSLSTNSLQGVSSGFGMLVAGFTSADVFILQIVNENYTWDATREAYYSGARRILGMARKFSATSSVPARTEVYPGLYRKTVSGTGQTGQTFVINNPNGLVVYFANTTPVGTNEGFDLPNAYAGLGLLDGSNSSSAPVTSYFAGLYTTAREREAGRYQYLPPGVYRVRGAPWTITGLVEKDGDLV